MTATYDPTLDTNIDRVRFLIRDTVTATALVQDEEIAWVLTENANVYLAAAAICDVLGGSGGGARQIVRFSVDGESVEFERARYRDLAAELRRKGRMKGVAPFAGGISVAGKQALEDDADRVRPAFTRALHSGAGSEV